MQYESDESVIDIDILVGFDIYDFLGQYPGQRSCHDISLFISAQDHPVRFANQISPCLAEMQCDFIREHINLNQERDKIKNLILFVKFWFKTEVKSEFHRARFPSYLIELLCLHVWETHLVNTKFDVWAWFHEVLSMIERKEELNVIWTEKYSLDQVPEVVSEQRPLLVDPANPFNNVAGGVAQWPEVSACARIYKRKLKES